MLSPGSIPGTWAVVRTLKGKQHKGLCRPQVGTQGLVLRTPQGTPPWSHWLFPCSSSPHHSCLTRALRSRWAGHGVTSSFPDSLGAEGWFSSLHARVQSCPSLTWLSPLCLNLTVFVTSPSLSCPICEVGLWGCLPPRAFGKSGGSDAKQVPGTWGASEPFLCVSGDVQLLFLPSELRSSISPAPLPAPTAPARVRPPPSLRAVPTASAQVSCLSLQTPGCLQKCFLICRTHHLTPGLMVFLMAPVTITFQIKSKPLACSWSSSRTTI